MKKSAFMTIAGMITSMIVDSSVTPDAFELGSLAILQQPLALAGLGYIAAGWPFQVVEHDHLTGLVGLRAVMPHPCLQWWDQLLILQPFNTEDALAAFNPPACDDTKSVAA